MTVDTRRRWLYARWLGTMVIVAWVWLLGRGDPRVVSAAPPGNSSHAKIAEPVVAEVDVALAVHRAGDPALEDARIPARGAIVVGHAQYVLAEPTPAGATLILLNGAEALWFDPSPLLDEVQMATIADGPFEYGRLDVFAARALPGGALVEIDRLGPRRDLSLVLPAGTERVELDYRVRVPHRYWPFGCMRRRCSLAGAVAPLPSERARGGRYASSAGRVVHPARWRVQAGFASERRPGRDEIVVIAQHPLRPEAPVAYPWVGFGPTFYRSIERHGGVEVEVLSLRQRPRARAPFEDPASPLRDVPGRILQIARDVLDRAFDVEIPLGPGTRIQVVHGPLRTRVADAHPTTVIVSDRAYELLTFERLLDFHDGPIARAIADFLALGHFAGRHDATTELWLAGCVGMWLETTWEREHGRRDESAADLLRGVAFVPAVDRFLYTGQAAFASAYFRGSDDDLGLREHPLFFAHDLPSGRRIYEKLVDLMPPDRLGAGLAAIVRQPDSDPRAALEQAWGRELGWLFDQWLGPMPPTNVALVSLDSRRDASGRWKTTLVVERASAAPLVEPIQVVARERGGRLHFLLWNGDPEDAQGIETLDDVPTVVRHTFALETTQKVVSATVDPRVRTVQDAAAPRPPRPGRRARATEDNVDARFDDRQPPLGRFIYTGFGFTAGFSEIARATTPQTRWAAITGFAAFETSLRRDLRRSGSFAIFKDRESILGGSGGVNFDFGRKRNAQRRIARLRISTGSSWLNAFGLDRSAGVRTFEAVSLSRDTRRFVPWPERGGRLDLSVSFGHTIPFDPDFGVRNAMTISGEWVQLWHLAHDHVLATQILAAVVTPLSSALDFRGLARGGGVGGLNAFSGEEIFGRGLLLSQIEYRHVFVNDLPINLFNLAWVRSLGGTLIGGVVSTSSCDDFRGWLSGPSWRGQVGYGLTAYTSMLGVSPQLIRLDVTVPIGPRTSTCLGRDLPEWIAEVQGLPPEAGARVLPGIGVNLLFVPAF